MTPAELTSKAGDVWFNSFHCAIRFSSRKFTATCNGINHSKMDYNQDFIPFRTVMLSNASCGFMNIWLCKIQLNLKEWITLCNIHTNCIPTPIFFHTHLWFPAYDHDFRWFSGSDFRSFCKVITEKKHCGNRESIIGARAMDLTLVSLCLTEITRYRSWFLEYKLTWVDSVPDRHPWWILYFHDFTIGSMKIIPGAMYGLLLWVSEPDIRHPSALPPTYKILCWIGLHHR